MRFSVAFVAAFVPGVVVALAILPFGLEASWAVPAALLLGALASGLGAWLAGTAGRRVRLLLPVLASSLASLVLAVPLGAALTLSVGTSLSIATPIVLAVVAAASAFAARRGHRGPGGSVREGRAGRARTLTALLALAAVAVLLFPVAESGHGWLTACRGEERAVFEEFPQYSPRTPEKLDPRPDLNAFTAVGGDCFVDYRTPDVASEVTGYFEERLRQNGWERPPGSVDPLYVRRGSYEYRVSFPDAPGGSARGTRVSVLVGEV